MSKTKHWWIKDGDSILESIARRANLAEGGEGVRDVLLRQFRAPNLTNKTLSMKTGIAIPPLAAVRGELTKEGILANKRKLSRAGIEWVKGSLGFYLMEEPAEDYAFDSLQVPTDFDELHSEIAGILERRPDPRFDLDQSRADSMTVTKRVIYMLRNGDIEGRKIIFLGDDDGTSLAASILGAKVTVLEIDARIVKYLEKESIKLDLKDFELIHHDLAEPVPVNIQKKFDVFFTDPPYTVPGLKLFCLRGKSCLKPAVGKRGYVCFGTKTPKTYWKSLLVLMNAGFTIQAIIPAFNRYKGASIIGKHSTMLYIKQVSWQPLLEETFTSPYYTAEVKEVGNQKMVFPDASVDNSEKYLGFHIIAEFYGVPKIRQLSVDEIEDMFTSSCQKADLSIVEMNTHRFYPHGVSVMAVLEESHASLHTWPENDYCSVDIFVCSGVEKGRKLLSLLEENLQPEKVKKSEFYRGRKQNDN
ncbi:MAG: adenosylmethionine decarboxylase [Candidatus Hodarchaeales archaeon]